MIQSVSSVTLVRSLRGADLMLLISLSTNAAKTKTKNREEKPK